MKSSSGFRLELQLGVSAWNSSSEFRFRIPVQKAVKFSSKNLPACTIRLSLCSWPRISVKKVRIDSVVDPCGSIAQVVPKLLPDNYPCRRVDARSDRQVLVQPGSLGRRQIVPKICLVSLNLCVIRFRWTRSGSPLSADHQWFIFRWTIAWTPDSGAAQCFKDNPKDSPTLQTSLQSLLLSRSSSPSSFSAHRFRPQLSDFSSSNESPPDFRRARFPQR